MEISDTGMAVYLQKVADLLDESLKDMMLDGMGKESCIEFFVMAVAWGMRRGHSPQEIANGITYLMRDCHQPVVQ